jgi:hypothetical protein
MSELLPGTRVEVDDFDGHVYIVAGDQSPAPLGTVHIWRRTDGQTYEACVQASRLHPVPAPGS